MKHAVKIMMSGAAIFIIAGNSAQAADLAIPEVIEAPVYTPAPEVVTESHAGGWYLRGDVGYGKHEFGGADYITYGAGPTGTGGAAGAPGFLTGDLKGSVSAGVGVGYEINKYLRTDVTLDHMFKSDFEGSTVGTCTVTDPGPDGILGTADDVIGTPAPCSSSDISEVSAWTLLANAYVDLGTYGRITPYVGAGIGGAKVKWGSLENCISGGFDQDGCITHEGHNEWRFAYALMAGASIEVNCRTDLDLGYRYKHIEGGKMFGYATDAAGFGAGPGYDRDIKSHEVRAGVRVKLGANACGGGGYAKTEMVSYEPEAVYK